MQNEWITVAQALNLLQITSRTTLYKFAYKYGIRVSKPLGRPYYNRLDILAAIENESITTGI